MSNITHDEILKDFLQETKDLIAKMQEILEEAEQDIKLAPRLENYGQMVDRIMGGTRLIALDIKDKDHALHKIADYTGICKAVGYKTSQIRDNPAFYQICIALLMDATDILQELVKEVERGTTNVNLKEMMSKTLIDRLKWVSDKFSAEYRSSVKVGSGAVSSKMSQEEIDKLMSKLGL